MTETEQGPFPIYHAPKPRYEVGQLLADGSTVEAVGWHVTRAEWWVNTRGKSGLAHSGGPEWFMAAIVKQPTRARIGGADGGSVILPTGMTPPGGMAKPPHTMDGHCPICHGSCGSNTPWDKAHSEYS